MVEAEFWDSISTIATTTPTGRELNLDQATEHTWWMIFRAVLGIPSMLLRTTRTGRDCQVK